METFPTVYWSAWNADVTFLPGTELPEGSQGYLWAVLAFVFYGDKLILADITGRGICVPSGRIEPGETIAAACERETYEETGAQLHPERQRLIGCYRLVLRSGAQPENIYYCPVFIAEALGFAPLPPESESRGFFLAAVEEVADLYFFWDELLAEVFSYAEAQKNIHFPIGMSVSSFIGN